VGIPKQQKPPRLMKGLLTMDYNAQTHEEKPVDVENVPTNKILTFSGGLSMEPPSPQVNWLSHQKIEENQASNNKLAEAYLYILSDDWGVKKNTKKQSESVGEEDD
jgi:hypothetical protein